MTNTSQMPDFYEAETNARKLVDAMKSARADLDEGLTDPLMAHYINKLYPPVEITGGQQV